MKSWNLHLVESLFTSCQQVVFTWLVLSSQKVWNKLPATCNSSVDIIIVVTRLFQKGRCNYITIVLQQTRNGVALSTACE